MNVQENINFHRIAQAIDFIGQNFKSQPSLDEIAGQVHLSPFHFQRLFTDWAGVSPKKFLQFLTVDHAKRILKANEYTLFETADEIGLSGTGRLHDLFVNIEGMTPGEFKNGGSDLTINYDFITSPFGNLIVASTYKGICYMAFADNQKKAFEDLKSVFPMAAYKHEKDPLHKQVTQIFTGNWKKPNEIKLHLKGTDFQLKVWETLLKIPTGELTTYGGIAREIGSPSASRAVGTAVGNNPVACLIPCHRVIQASGAFGQYHWGSTRKAALIGWEASKTVTV